MQEYLVIIYGKNDNRSIRLGYRNGELVSAVTTEGQQCNEAEQAFLFLFASRYISEAQLLEQAGKPMKVRYKLEAMPTDLSFTAFWDAYGYKVGDKKRTEKLWNALNTDEKIKCLSGTKKYNAFIARNYVQQKAYPETFLSQNRWENEYNT